MKKKNKILHVIIYYPSLLKNLLDFQYVQDIILDAGVWDELDKFAAFIELAF